ncbi:MAG: energy transducer TonB [Cyclobacteriaceae bacterium]|nr:energy transducer TonB [Cyclobacteriaceae bacterium]
MYPALLFSGLTISIAFVAMAFQWRTKKILPDCQLPQPETAHLTYESPLVIEKTGAAPKLVKKVPPIDIHQLSISDNPLQLDTFSLTTAELPSETGLDSFTSPTPEPVPDTFLIVEKMPQPVGGFSKFYSFISKTIKYPTQAKRNHTEGKVFVEFVVDRVGNVSDVKVIKGIGSGRYTEAARVLALTRWEPGKQRGVPVVVKMVIPEVFRLD